MWPILKILKELCENLIASANRYVVRKLRRCSKVPTTNIEDNGPDL